MDTVKAEWWIPGLHLMELEDSFKLTYFFFRL
jgi:hypothetical protein